MNRHNAFASYQAVQMETASPERLLLMLYEGAIRFLDRARTAIEGRDAEEAHRCLLRVQDILAELTSTLDFEVGSEVATNLSQLYEYYTYRLAQANMRKDARLVDEVREHLQLLLGAWQEAVKRAAGEGVQHHAA